MKVVISKLELDQIIRNHLSDTIVALQMSEENSIVEYVKNSSSTRIDEVHVEVWERT